MLETIITAILSSSVVAGLILWVSKTWLTERLKSSIQFEYNQKLEVHKTELKSEAEKELLQIRTQVQLDAEKRSIQYTRVFEDIATVVAEVYNHIYIVKMNVAGYVSPFGKTDTPERFEARVKALDAINELKEHFGKKQIYLPHETAVRIDGYVSEINRITFEFMWHVETTPLSADQQCKWIEVNRYIEQEAPKLLSVLEKDFRYILGVDEAIESQNK